MAEQTEAHKALYKELEALLAADKSDEATAKLAEIEALENGEAQLTEEVLKAELEDIAPDIEITAIDEPKEVTPVAKASEQIKLGDISEVVESATPVVKENAAVSITKDQLGITEFESVLDSLTEKAIDELIVQVAETEDLSVLVFDGVSVLDADHRIHLQTSGDVSRAARGAALYTAGGVANGFVTSPSGNMHEIRDGICLSLKKQNQINGDGSVTPLYAESACKGHLVYKKTAGQFTVVPGKQHLRCKHAWALMFEAGYFVSFSTKSHDVRVAFEIANSVGDKTARAWAKEIQGQWEETRQDKYETRKTFATAINAAKNEGNVTTAGMLPAASQIADFKLPNGKTVEQAVQELKGQRFALRIQVPVNGETRETMTRITGNLSELANVIAPAFQVCKMAGKDLVVLEVCPR
jgi:hypothetical protein